MLKNAILGGDARHKTSPNLRSLPEGIVPNLKLSAEALFMFGPRKSGLLKGKWIILAFAVMSVRLLAGCGTLFVPQVLSENYARANGVICNAPEAVDGDLNTATDKTRILISLPEKKSIRKIVIYSPNISNFILYDSTGIEGGWHVIKSVKGNKLTKIVIDAQVTTDKIRMFVTDTRGTKFAGPNTLKDEDGRTNLFSRQVDAPPKIQEIELYGLVDKVKSNEPLF